MQNSTNASIRRMVRSSDQRLAWTIGARVFINQYQHTNQSGVRRGHIADRQHH
jgi:hypothetical protein